MFRRRKITAYAALLAMLLSCVSPVPIMAEEDTMQADVVMVESQPEEPGEDIQPVDELDDLYVPSNPDNLPGPDPVDGITHLDPIEMPPARTDASSRTGNMTPRGNGTEPPQWVKDAVEADLPTEANPVKVYPPIITEDPTQANLWEIKLLVAAMDTVQTSKIVLVIDTSNSMEGARLIAAKNAAKAFVENVLDSSTNTEIALVDFGTSVNSASEFTNNKADLNAAIDGMTLSGGTFTQGGYM